MVRELYRVPVKGMCRNSVVDPSRTPFENTSVECVKKGLPSSGSLTTRHSGHGAELHEETGGNKSTRQSPHKHPEAASCLCCQQASE